MNEPKPTSDDVPGSVEDNPEFQQAVADCIQQLESGRIVDAAWIEKHYPRWHKDLAVFIADWGAVEGYSNEVRNVQQNPVFTADIPDSIDEYQVLEQIGAGGMGVIYKARHRRLSRIVAIKMLHNIRHDRKRFELEAEAVSRLDHPNIVSIFEVGEHEGNPFFTMPFIDGCDLDSLINQKDLSPQHAASVAAQMRSRFSTLINGGYCIAI